MSDAISSPTITSPSAQRKIRKTAWVAAALLTGLLTAAVIAPHLIDLGLFKSTYLPRVEDALNRRVDVGEVRLSLLPAPSIRVSDFRVFEGASTGDTFFSVQQVQLRLRLWPLLKGRFEVSELMLDKPSFNLVRQADGTYNYADIADKKSSPAPRREVKKRADTPRSTESAGTPLLLPANISIRDGQVHLLSKNRPSVTIRGIELSLRDVSGEVPFPFHASFDYPGLKNVSLTGSMTYQEEKATLNLKNGQIKVQDLALPFEGTASNLAAAPRLNFTSVGENVDARPVFQILSIFGLAPRDTEVAGPMTLQMSVIGPSNQLTTQVRGLFKDVKVHGKRAFKGTLRGEVSLRLPAGAGPVSKRMQGSGKLAARDGELTNVDLIRKIERVTGTIGLSKEEQRQATTFQTMEADFIIGGGYTEFSRLYLVNPQMEVTGAGTMTIDQPALNLAINTALSSQASNRAGRGRMTTFLKDKQGRIVVPLKIVGPVENPSVDLDTGKLAENKLPQSAEKGFSSFFQRLFRGR